MRALVITGPGSAWAEDVEAPAAGPGPSATGRRIAGVTVGLDEAAEALAGKVSAGAGTKIHIDACA